MNSNNNLKILLISFALCSIVGAYYIGYMSAKLNIPAPFIPSSASVTDNSSDKNAKQQEPKLVEQVAPISLKGDEVFIGDSKSKMLLIVFTDFECPFCARFYPGLNDLQKSNNAKLVYKHFPLTMHPNAKKFAHIFECIGKNSSFVNAATFASDLYAQIMKTQGQVSLDDGKKLANKFINNQTIENCIDDKEIGAKIDAHYNEGIELGIQGTPALYIINTESNQAVRINGALDGATLQTEFDKIK